TGIGALYAFGVVMDEKIVYFVFRYPAAETEGGYILLFPLRDTGTRKDCLFRVPVSRSGNSSMYPPSVCDLYCGAMASVLAHRAGERGGAAEDKCDLMMTVLQEG